MKTINAYFLLLFTLLISSCARDFDAPPLTEPKYTGDPANITVAKLKDLYKEITNPQLIEVDYILKASVVGNDISGNVYKQLYVQDETGGINIGVDQNSMYTTFRVGQEVYIDLHGLYMVKYGNELQIGMGTTNANRIVWEDFVRRAHVNGWPDAASATPKVVTLGTLTDNMVNTLVRLDNIYFVNGGKATFTIDDKTTNQAIKDGNGNTLDVRTSNFSTFAAEMLPAGSGSLVGLLSRYNGGWQFYIRDTDDIINFGGELPAPGTDPGTGGGTVYFNETFGTGTYPSGNRPKITDFTDFDMKTPIKYSDASAAADIRSVTGNNGAHVWLPANKDSYLTIEGINTSAGHKVILSYELAGNLFNAGETANLNNIGVTVDGVAVSVPGKDISNANGDNSKFYKITLENIPAKANLKIEFVSGSTANLLGFRLDNIKLMEDDGSIVITPIQ